MEDRFGRADFHDIAELSVKQIDDLIRACSFHEPKAKQIRDNKLGDLTIASYPDIAIDFLPKVLSRLLQDDRSIHVRLLARRSEMMSGLLPTHEYDMAIVTQVAETRDLDVEEVRLSCLLAFPRGQASGLPPTVGPADLRGARLVTLMPTHPTVVQLAERFAQAGIPFPGAMVETQTFESACGFIRRGVGMGLLDPITTARYAEADIELRRFEPEVFQSIFLLVPADRPVSRLLLAFRKQLMAEFDALRLGKASPASGIKMGRSRA